MQRRIHDWLCNANQTSTLCQVCSLAHLPLEKERLGLGSHSPIHLQKLLLGAAG